MYSCSKKGELLIRSNGPCHVCLVHFFVNIANCAFLCALEINDNEKLLEL